MSVGARSSAPQISRGNKNKHNGKKGWRGAKRGARIASGFPGPGAHFLSSPWLRRMMSAELAILADTGSNSARCPLWGPTARSHYSFIRREAPRPRGFEKAESRSSQTPIARALTRGS